MKKRTKIIFVGMILILFTGIIFTSVNYFMSKDKKISSRIMKKLSDTKKIVIKDGNNILGTITEESIITEILSIMSEATGNMNKADICIGTTIYFEMYNDDILIDKIHIFLNRAIMPRSIAKGCAKYYFPLKSKNNITIIIEEQTEIKF